MYVVPLVALAVLGLWAVLAFRTPTDRHVGALARMYGASLNPVIAAGLRRRIAGLRRTRFAGAVLGLAVALVSLYVRAADGDSGGRLLFGVAIGYGVGSLAAELIWARQQPAGRVATAHRRSFTALITTWAAVPVVLAVVCAYAGIVLAGFRRDRLGVTWTTIGLVAVAVTATCVAALVALRMVVTAPERADSTSEVVVIRISRSITIMSVMGSTWMSVGVAGGWLLAPWYDVDRSPAASLLIGAMSIYLAASTTFGFLTTLSALPRTGGYLRVPEVPA